MTYPTPPDPELQEAVIRRVRRGRERDVRRLARFMKIQDTGPIAPVRTSVIITLRLQAWDYVACSTDTPGHSAMTDTEPPTRKSL